MQRDDGFRMLELARKRQRGVESVPLVRESPIGKKSFNAHNENRSLADGAAHSGGGENRCRQITCGVSLDAAQVIVNLTIVSVVQGIVTDRVIPSGVDNKETRSQ